MAKLKKSNVEVQPHQVGDTVMWKGIPLVVYAVYPDGSLVARSQTMMVTVSGPEQFDRVTNYGG